jgi:hypothetical protein
MFPHTDALRFAVVVPIPPFHILQWVTSQLCFAWVQRPTHEGNDVFSDATSPQNLIQQTQNIRVTSPEYNKNLPYQKCKWTVWKCCRSCFRCSPMFRVDFQPVNFPLKYDRECHLSVNVSWTQKCLQCLSAYQQTDRY